jgi:transcriptional regulator with XRE-family HTH domain
MSSFITPEQADKILSADFRNVARKVADGKTLTAAERELIQAKAASGIPDAEDASISVKTFEELAQLLGVTVRTINRWRKLEGAPQPLPEGGLPLADWRQFVKVRNLKKLPSPEVERLKARKLLAEVEERELKVAVKKGEFVRLDDVRSTWVAQVGKAIALLRAKFENELPPILSGKDAQGIREECAKAIDEVCGILHTGGGTTP